jgi:hypothetical protein
VHCSLFEDKVKGCITEKWSVLFCKIEECINIFQCSNVNGNRRRAIPILELDLSWTNKVLNFDEDSCVARTMSVWLRLLPSWCMKFSRINGLLMLLSITARALNNVLIDVIR